MQKHSRKFGPIGSTVVAVFCVGGPVINAGLAALGLSLRISDVVLIPLLLVSLTFGLFGLWHSYQKHRRREPLILHTMSAVLLLFFAFVVYVLPLFIVGIIGVVAGSFWDFRLRKKHHQY